MKLKVMAMKLNIHTCKLYIVSLEVCYQDFVTVNIILFMMFRSTTLSEQVAQMKVAEPKIAH